MEKKHNGFTTFMAVATCKAARKACQLAHRGGTTFPGEMAMKIDPNVLEVVSQGMEVIVVTGTNGKTTTSRMIEQALTKSGKETLANKTGANLLSGVTAEFAFNATASGKPRQKYAVVECDEAALKLIVPLVHPKVILVTNLFRDQLDRYGEVMHTLEQIRLGVEKCPESVLVLNADCSLTSSLALDVPNPVVYYGLDTPVGDQKEATVSDAKYCIKCGTEYHYDYRTFAHLGGYVCPKCGYKRTEPSVAVTEIEKVTSSGSFVKMKLPNTDGTSEVREVKIALPAVYNIYNAASAVAAYIAAGLDKEEIVSSLADVSSSFGRMETFDLDGVPIQMILVKNPAGCNQALEYLHDLDEDFNAVFFLNDRVNDGHDISWIWDAEYEKICTEGHMKHAVVSGLRAEDMQLRLKYAGASEDIMEVIQGNEAIIDQLRESKLPVFILPNYTAMLKIRNDLGAACGKGEFWKGV